MKTALTDLQAPMELLGAHQGVSVIDPATILTRLWYFDGKFLSASGFRMDQQYVRSLVALSNQGNGTGVVHGFDARRGNGDQIDVDGGLAMAPSGRVVYLPQQTSLSISQLIDRSSGTSFSPASTTKAGAADFQLCPPQQPTGPDQQQTTSVIWLLTVAAAEALCGEEERYGQLCESACATETDRSVAVEGVVFRVRQLSLDLPVSSIPFNGLHLRSQVASAYYEAERKQVVSGISGAGLRSASIWCAGADGIGGEEVPLAVFNRSGGITSWIDMWTGRREIMETTPQRYWGRRFAMRPLDIFLAQVLQFQCQLLTLGTDGPDIGGDPCADEREALLAANAVLGGLLDTAGEVTVGPVPEVVVTDGLTGLRADLPVAAFAEKTLTQLTNLNVLIANALVGKSPSASGSALIDGGIIETPSGGYLPVDPNKDVQAQVHAFFGPGVDLRFCAVRPDFIPEALQEAQHMERISLTQGIDNPDDIEEVDVLVPGGQFESTAPVATNVFEGDLRLLPNQQGDNEPALELKTFARDRSGDKWAWSMVAYSGVGNSFNTKHLGTLLKSGLAKMKVADNPNDDQDGGIEGATPTVRIVADGASNVPSDDEVASAVEALRSVEGGPRRFEMQRELRIIGRRRHAARMMAEAAAPKPQSGQPDTAPFTDPGVFVHDDGDLLLNDAAIYGWIDFEVAADLTTLSVGDQAAATATVVGYLEVGDQAAIADLGFTGSLEVISKHPTGTGFGTRVTTAVTGLASSFIDNAGDIDTGSEDAGGITIDWVIATTSDGKKVARLEAVRQTGREDDDGRILLEFADVGSPRQVQGVLELERTAQPPQGGPPVTDQVPIADTSLSENEGALDPGTPGRDISQGVIQVLNAQLLSRQRRPGFGSTASNRLFGFDAVNGSSSTLKATADWVMFHRRRTMVCSGESTTEQPVALRRYRWYHAEVNDPEFLRQLRIAFSPRASTELRAAVFEKAEFELVSTLDFVAGRSELRTSATVVRADFQRHAPKADRLVMTNVAESPTGDGEVIGKGRAESLTAALAPVVDVSQTFGQVAVGIPVEFQATGVDGVLFTVGAVEKSTEPVDPETEDPVIPDPITPENPPTELPVVRATLMRIPTSGLAILDRLSGVVDEVTLLRALSRTGADISQTTANFAGAEIMNKDKVLAFAEDGLVLDRVRFGFDQDFIQSATDETILPWKADRANTLAQLLGRRQELNATSVSATFNLNDSQAIFFFLTP